jgi:membrane protease YdiL (CAAX protease family)
MVRLFKFEPSRNLWYLLVGWVAVVSSLVLAFRVFTTAAVALNFIFFGVIGIALFGIGFPVYVNCVVERRPLSDLGIGRARLGRSLAIGIVLAAVQYAMTLRQIAWPSLTAVIPLAALSLAVSLYEAVFYRGFIQQRLEKAFGLIPSLVLGALIYTLYHVGYPMTLSEVPLLFWVGLTYAVVFRLTRNIFILWPLLSPMGAFFSNLNSGLVLPFPATYGFADSLLLMAGLMAWGAWTMKKRAALKS